MAKQSALYSGGEQIPSDMSPGILRFVRYALIFVGIYYEACFISPFWRLAFSV